MKVLRKIIEIDEEKCDGCGNCVPACAEGAIEIVDGKARVVADKFCDGLGACLGECPQDALHIVEREAEEFDETAVETRLKEMEHQSAGAPEPALACGCPSTQMQTFVRAGATPCQRANEPSGVTGAASALSHWPVKIRLVPARAPFLKGADLLVLADCTATAYPLLHQDLLEGKVVMMGCPKFDDAEGYVEKFREIFQSADIRSITTARMEVPCCAGLPAIVRKGLQASGLRIPMEEVVVGKEGQILERQKVA